MSKTRRRRLAWLFALVLFAELALLCCASAHACSHLCPGRSCCAICAVLNPEHRCALLALILLIGLALAVTDPLTQAPRTPVPLLTPISLRVRIND